MSSDPRSRVVIALRGGYRSERTNEAGFAHLVEHLSFSCGRYGDELVHDLLCHELRITYGAFTRYDYWLFWADVPVELVDWFVAYETDRIRNYQSSDGAIDRNYRVVHTEIAGRSESYMHGRFPWGTDEVIECYSHSHHSYVPPSPGSASSLHRFHERSFRDASLFVESSSYSKGQRTVPKGTIARVLEIAQATRREAFLPERASVNARPRLSEGSGRRPTSSACWISQTSGIEALNLSVLSSPSVDAGHAPTIEAYLGTYKMPFDELDPKPWHLQLHGLPPGAEVGDSHYLGALDLFDAGSIAVQKDLQLERVKWWSRGRTTAAWARATGRALYDTPSWLSEYMGYVDSISPAEVRDSLDIAASRGRGVRSAA